MLRASRCPWVSSGRWPHRTLHHGGLRPGDLHFFGKRRALRGLLRACSRCRAAYPGARPNFACGLGAGIGHSVHIVAARPRTVWLPVLPGSVPSRAALISSSGDTRDARSRPIVGQSTKNPLARSPEALPCQTLIIPMVSALNPGTAARASDHDLADLQAKAC